MVPNLLNLQCSHRVNDRFQQTDDILFGEVHFRVVTRFYELGQGHLAILHKSLVGLYAVREWLS